MGGEGGGKGGMLHVTKIDSCNYSLYSYICLVSFGSYSFIVMRI